MANSPYLSIIVPAYNEENRLPSAIRHIQDFLENEAYEAELIIVENGSSDKTYEIAKQFADMHNNIKVISLDQAGKGRAVKAGMLLATGEYRFLCDSDLSMPITELPRFLPNSATDEIEIVIGSRETEGAKRFNEPDYRHIGGRFVNILIRLLAIPKIQDTQCGFKLFRADIANDVFSKQTVMGFGFDIEILFIALKRGYAIKELGIPWYYQDESKVSPLKDTIKMFFEIMQIRLNNLKGRYEKEI
jgi:glycosyltransferase involved in cell wall biosynthesis